MCEYYLGGKDNYAAGRAAVEAALQIDPGPASTARANRAFLGRAVHRWEPAQVRTISGKRVTPGGRSRLHAHAGRGITP